jgi:hypothetical protein
MPRCVAGVLIFAFPVFDAALGLALMGTVAGTVLSEWKNQGSFSETPE